MVKKKVRAVKSVKRAKSPVITSSRSGMTRGLAIAALILNIFIVPGLGTLVAGKSRTGAMQLALWVVGAVFISAAYLYSIPVLLIGGPLWIAAWIWGLVSGIKFIQEAR